MHYYSARHKCIWILFPLIILLSTPNGFTKSYIVQDISEDLISDLYSKYKEATGDDLPDSTRRLFVQNRQYRIHVRKLKEVNGFKTHNLMINEEVDTKTNPLVYINNPVESKFPNAYLTLEEFKQALINRVQIQRQSLTKQSKLPLRTQKVTEVKRSKLPLRIQKVTEVKTSKHLRTQKVTEVNTSKLQTKTNTTNDILSKTTAKKISSIKPYKTPIVTTLSKLTFKMSQNVTDNEKIIKSNYLSTTSAIITTAVTKQSSEQEKNRNMDSLNKMIEITTGITAFEENVLTNSLETFVPTSGSLIEQSRESTAPEDFTEEQTEDEKATTVTVVTEATRLTRRTLGRPLVFMGGNK